MQNRNIPLSIDQKVANLLNQMTLTEKIAQLGSCWFHELQTEDRFDIKKAEETLKNGMGQITRVAGSSTLNPIQTAKTINQIQQILINHSRLGIPAIFHDECCSGILAFGASEFPQMIGLACTFHPQLAEKMTIEIRRQMRVMGVRHGLAPVLDIVRDPRWGRVEETFGEDPLLVSQFGVAYIRGLQGKDLQTGVMATGKHFLAHGLPEGGLNCAPVQAGKRFLWEIYLMPFQAAIQDANLATIMNSYSELDGEVVATSYQYLTDLLREKLGFNGLVVSDYDSIDMIHSYHQAASDRKKAAAMALHAGIDVELPTSKCYTEDLIAAVESGSIKMEWIDLAVSRHLQKKFELGLFDAPFVREEGIQEVFETPSQRELALQIARESIVLLTNNSILPLQKTINTLAVIGPNANDTRNLFGDYSYESAKEMHISQQNSIFDGLDHTAIQDWQLEIPTILESIKTKIPTSTVLYSKGCNVFGGDDTGFKEALDFVNQADVTVLVLGDKAGMTADSTCGETRDSTDLMLSEMQMDLARRIFAIGKPVVVVLVNGRPLAIRELVEKASSIVEAWLPGERGGNAIADVLFGDYNPGGKLAITFPQCVGQVPIFYNHKLSGAYSNSHANYISDAKEPLFPFGHGLSYTTFKYSDLQISKSEITVDEFVNISMKVKNIGSITGDEVVQLYIRDEYASLPRPVKELKGYKRLTLNPQQEKTIVFHLPANLLAFYDRDFNLCIEAGMIHVMIGSSSEDIRLSGQFEIIGPEKILVKKREFVCPVDIC